MKIANPMYDVSFKYLIEDISCAKLLLGEIIQKEILECELLNNEIVSLEDNTQASKIIKLDFKAKIKTSEGAYLMVIIEVQKQSKESNLIRFRQYLGDQYSNKQNVYLVDKKKVPFPIFSIYFLGYNIGLANHIPVIKVKSQHFDYTLGDSLQGSCTFTDALSHEMVIIQTKALRKDRRSLLEVFLATFVPDNNVFLEIEYQQFDRKFVSLIKRLNEAAMKKEIVEAMQRENVIQEEWDGLVDEIEGLRKQNHEEKKQKEEERRQKEMAIAKEVEERKQKETALNLVRSTISTLLELGLTRVQIAEKLQIPAEEIDSLLGNKD